MGTRRFRLPAGVHRHTMRVLIVSHPPLDPTFGAAQTAMELAAALRARAHEVEIFTPEPLPARKLGVTTWQAQSARLEEFLARAPQFDVIDVPAISLTAKVAAQGFAVARSVQPEFQYQRVSLGAELCSLSPRFPGNLAMAWRARREIVKGWQRADAILCLGSLERAWMANRFPRWKDKTFHYISAPPGPTRTMLLDIRSRRSARPRSTRALWIGRWSAHKDPQRLLRIIEHTLPRSSEGFTVAGCGQLVHGSIRRSWGASGLVEVIPRFSRDELPELLSRHTVGLFTSSAEGWGLTLNEMLESGMTVYATAAGGVPDLQPYFPNALRPLRDEGPFEPFPLDDLLGNCYFDEYSWPAIAARYENEILSLAQ